MQKNNVFAWSLVVALGGFLFGFDTAVISGAEKAIQAYWSLNVFEHGLTVSIALIGTILGALLGRFPSEKLGRKKTLILIAVWIIDHPRILHAADGVKITLGHMIALRETLPPEYQGLPDDVLPRLRAVAGQGGAWVRDASGLQPLVGLWPAARLADAAARALGAGEAAVHRALAPLAPAVLDLAPAVLGNANTPDHFDATP